MHLKLYTLYLISKSMDNIWKLKLCCLVFVYILPLKSVCLTNELTDDGDSGGDLMSIIYSPYIDEWDTRGLPPSIKSKDEYSLKDITNDLHTISAKFRSVFTLGMGVTNTNERREWNRTNSECLIGTAGGKINREWNETIIKIAQGINIGKFDEIELRNAISSVKYSNSLFSDTVWAVVFIDSSNTGSNNLAQFSDKVLNILKTHQTVLKELNVKLGVRPLNCENDTKKLSKLGEHFDFIICPFYPENYDGEIKFILKEIKSNFEDLKIIFYEINRVRPRQGQVELYLETGWPTTGLKINKNPLTLDDNNPLNKIILQKMIEYIKSVQYLSVSAPIKTIFFEAFDQPGKCDVYRETVIDTRSKNKCHFGQWTWINYQINSAEEGLTKETAVKGIFIEKSSLLTQNINEDGILWKILFGLIALLFFIVIICAMAIWLYRIKIAKRNHLTESEISEFLNGMRMDREDEENVEGAKKDEITTATKSAQILPYDKGLELPKHKFTIDRTFVLGSGTFGTVYKGNIYGLSEPVAFKTVHSDAHSTGLKDILSEIKILTFIGKHEHIVNLKGAYTKDLRKGMACMALEYCSKGSLQNVLRSAICVNESMEKGEERISYKNIINTTTTAVRRYIYDPSSYVNIQGCSESDEITFDNQLKWSTQIAKAMAFLEYKKVCHADLATRNVLLTNELDIKITDFGLSRRMYEYANYVKKTQEPLPWRWMSIESLREMNFSTKSDVWSYGVTLWEIFSYGDIPYPGLNWSSDFSDALSNGLRLIKPNSATTQIYGLMMECWRNLPKDRPSFKSILNYFNQQEEGEEISFYQNTSEK